MRLWHQVKHRCGHTSAMQSFPDGEEAFEAEIVRLESLPCRKCWVKENGYESTGTFCVEIPAGL